MTITLEIDGNRFEGFTAINVFRSVEAISGSFQFAATSSKVINFPISAGQACRVLINDIPVITGFVEVVGVSYNATGHSLDISGRDGTSDVIDSTVAGGKEFTAPITLEQIITTSLSNNNITGIEVINNAGNIEPFAQGQSFSASVGETLFAFFEKYARKKQVLLSTDGKGNIVLNRAGSTATLAPLRNVKNGQQNNILSGSIRYSETDRFNKYTIRSQGNNSSILDFFGTSNENAVDQKNSAIDTDIKREGRQLDIISNSSDDNVTLGDLATWHANLRRIRGTEYNVIVQGFFQDKQETRLWIPNELVQIEDEFADVSATQLIKSVEYNLSEISGTTTTISLVDKDAYTLQANISSAEAASNSKGEILGF